MSILLLGIDLQFKTQTLCLMIMVSVVRIHRWSRPHKSRLFTIAQKLVLVSQTLDIWCVWCYHSDMKEKHRWPTTSIRANPEVLHQARIAAVTQKKTLGQWLEEAIVEKIEREKKLVRGFKVESSTIR